MTLRSLALAAAILVGLSTAAAAQSQPSPEMRAQARAVMQACRADIQKHCPGVQPGGGRIGACLQQHAAQLTQPCRDGLAAIAQKQSQSAPPTAAQ